MDKYSSRIERPEQHPPESLETVLARYRTDVERAMSDAYKSENWISGAVAEAIGTGGKRLRPVAALLVCEAITGDHKPALPVAVAYELAHAASLIQDDIIDESSMRHGAPTTYKKYGVSRAILLSDAMIFEIFTQLASYGETKMTREGIVQLVEHVGRAAKLAAEGELLDVTLAARGGIKEEEYLKVAALKTGALFGGACASGAIAAMAEPQVVDKMYEFGIALGIAFQMGDDILDMMGDTKGTGKPAFKDIENNAGNIVLLHALSKASPIQRNSINSMLFKKWFTAIEAENLIHLLEELGSFEYATSLLNSHTAKCRAFLTFLPSSKARDVLEGITHMVEVRRA